MKIPSLSPLEIQVLIRLVSGSKTVLELKDGSGANYAELLGAVKNLSLKKRIERKKGFPTKYTLSDSTLLLAKRLRAKHDMSDLFTDPCHIDVPTVKE